MSSDAMFIDCVRGGVYDEWAVYEALLNNKIAGAALDVFIKEPTSLVNCPLLGLENFACTPHLGVLTNEARKSVALIESQQKIILLSTDEIVEKELLAKVKNLKNITKAQVLDLTSV